MTESRVSGVLRAATRLRALAATHLSNQGDTRLAASGLSTAAGLRLSSRARWLSAAARPMRLSRLLVDIRLSSQVAMGLKGRRLAALALRCPGAPQKKSPMIIAIVAAAIVLLAAVGGIIMVLTRNGGGEQPDVTITPSQPVPPTEQPTPEPTRPANDSGTAAHTDRDLAAASRWHHQSRQRDRAHTGRRLGGQEDRQERGAAVRREECLPRPIAADLAVD